MNKILLTISVIICVNIVYSQSSFTIQDLQGVNVVDDTVYVQGDANAFEIVEEFVVTNVSTNTLSVKAKKEELSLLSGTSSAFCWVLCYAPSVYISSFSRSMGPGDFTSGADNLSGHYYPSGFTGTSIIKYTVFDMNNTTDEASVTVIFDAVTSIENSQSIYINRPYPNPANEQAIFTYNINSQNAVLTIFDIVGNNIGSYKLDANKYVLNTSKLHSGTYLYTITVNGIVEKTDRLIVNH